MKKFMKRTISMILVVALVVTGNEFFLGKKQTSADAGTMEGVELEEYWSNIDRGNYGIYPVDQLYETHTWTGGSMENSNLVQADVIAKGDTYEVVYEEGKDLFFYLNPHSYKINFETDEVYWSGNREELSEDFNSAVAEYVKKTDATVQYRLSDSINFGIKDYVTTEIACQVRNGNDVVVDIKFTLKVLNSHGIYIEDEIRKNGCLSVRDPQEGAAYVWQKSEDGVSWKAVNEKRYDLTIVNENGMSVNIAMDLGGGMYYRVQKVGSSEWSQPYRVPFYNEVQNGDFEFPAMWTPDEPGAKFPFNGYGGEEQFPNGYPGMVWKTTGPGWGDQSTNSNNVGHDIEIVNGRRLKVDRAREDQENIFSVKYEEMYGGENAGKYGDQFAELNCENVGALYQDILTTPGSECYWDLDHAGRHRQNTMYVVAMSSQVAQDYTTEAQIDKIVVAAGELGELPDTTNDNYSAQQSRIYLGEYEEGDAYAYVWKVTSPQGENGKWVHHSGKYIVPDDQDRHYLTRFFFVSAEFGDDATVGNLLDNVSFEMKQRYTVEYYLDGNLQTSIDGISVPYDRIDIKEQFEGYDFTQYTLVKSEIGGVDSSSFKPFYVDDSSNKMTIAYNHNVLKLYYETTAVAITKKIVGMSSIPEKYTFDFHVQSMDGNTTDQTFSCTGADFTMIDKESDSDPDSCFVRVIFSDVQWSDDSTYKIVEGVSDLFVTVDNNKWPYYLEEVQVNGAPAAYDENSPNKYAGEFTYHSGQENKVIIVNTYSMDTGDVEVQGFQMNTNTAPGGASENNPSFRVVCRVSNNTIKHNKVVKCGVIYGMSDALPEDRKSLEEVMVLEPGVEYDGYVYSHETTDQGFYKEWTTKDGDEHPADKWDYYALTFIGTSYVYKAIQQKLTFRAYAITIGKDEDGNDKEIIEYGDNIYTVDMYEIADDLYRNQKMSTKTGHEFLYTNILNLVQIDKNRYDIAKAMMDTLGINSAGHDDYPVANQVYRDMLSYVYCMDGYAYQGRENFKPINIQETEYTYLLGRLNEGKNVEYKSLHDWIYNVTDYFYKTVPYEWDNGIYKKTKKN